MGVWRLDCDQFASLWLGVANEAFPEPLTYTSRFRFLDAWEAFRTRTRLEYAAAEFQDLHRALVVMAASTVSARVVGSTPAGAVTVRMLGCVDDGQAVVAGQRPANGRVSGDIVLRTGTADELSVMLARSMPPAAPGRKAGGRFYRSDIESDGHAVLRQAMAKSPDELYHEISSAPRALTVSVQGVPGPCWAAAEPVSSFEILDLEADGRYLRHGSDPITIAPAGAPELATLFRSTLARAAEAAPLGTHFG